MGEQNTAIVQEKAALEGIEKTVSESVHLENTVTLEDNLVYNAVDEEPEIHMRTWIALAAMFLLNLVQVFALQGPPAVVSKLKAEETPPLTPRSCPTLEQISTIPKQRHGCQTPSHSSKQSFAP